jgi:hypothetical protein
VGLRADAGPYAVDTGPATAGHLGAGIASGLGMFLRCWGDTIASGQIRVCTHTPARSVAVNDREELITVAVGAGPDDAVQLSARAVVLAAGAFESVRLAMVSEIPDPSGRLGRRLQEHHFYRCRFDAPHVYGPQPDTAVIYVPSSSQDTEQWELHLPGRTLFTAGEFATWAPAVGERYQIMMRSFSATDKDADNYMVPEATATAPPNTLGAATVHFRHTAADLARREAMQASAELIANAVGWVDGEPVGATDRFRPIGSSYHEAGGLDMGSDPTSSVTDPQGRFHAVPQLISADAASFPAASVNDPRPSGDHNVCEPTGTTERTQWHQDVSRLPPRGPGPRCVPANARQHLYARNPIDAGAAGVVGVSACGAGSFQPSTGFSR